MVMRVAVIGAGYSGLVALRHLTALPEKFQATAYEQSDVIGGTWVYTDEVGKNKYGEPVFTSMYRDLRTNLPKEVMGLPDFPYESTLPSYMKHEYVRDYLEKYAGHFNLMKYINLLTRVVNVMPVERDSGKTKWQVTTQPVRQQDQSTECQEFDAVMVCNGHFSAPRIPTIPGMEDFTGDVIHSHDYRSRERYEKKRVIVLGAGFSGIDIALDVAQLATKVILSHNTDLWKCSLPPNMTQAAGIASMKPNSAILRDNSEEQVDSVILCTGYERNFPFLSKECGIEVTDGRITPLYKHVINTVHPTMSLIGVCDNLIPFCFHHQVQFVIKTLTGDCQLPSKTEMDLDTENDFLERLNSGSTSRQAHYMSRRQWAYYEDLSRLANLDGVQQAIPNLYDDFLRDSITLRFQDYKNDNYEYVGNNRFKLSSK